MSNKPFSNTTTGREGEEESGGARPDGGGGREQAKEEAWLHDPGPEEEAAGQYHSSLPSDDPLSVTTM